MSQQNDLTLQQLAQIALGSTSLGNINVSLLYTIINFALKKLDCENEKIVISGAPVENIQKLLQTSTTGPSLKLDESGIKAPIKQYKNIIHLEEKVKIIEDNLNHHLAEVSFRKTFDKHLISKPCQTKCEHEEEKDEMIRALLRKDYLLNQLTKNLTQPLKCRMNILDENLKELSKGIEDFKKQCFDAHKLIDKLDDLLIEFQILTKEISINILDSDATKVEIQQKMDLKLNNCDILPFKAYFKNRWDQLSSQIEKTLDEESKFRALICTIKPVIKTVGVRYEEKKETNESTCKCDEGRNVVHVSLPERTMRISLENAARSSDDRLKFHFQKEILHYAIPR